MKTRRILGLVAGTALLVAGAAGQEAAAPSPRKAARVEQEYGLARTPSTYFIFDFEAGKVSLKARGLVLKEWPIFKVKTWGRHGGVMTCPLLKKTAYNAPKRKDVTPGKAEDETDKKPTAKNDDLDILELVKMPVNFTLELPGDIRMNVRLRKSGFARILDGAGRLFSRGIGRSVKTIVRGIGRRPFTEIEIIFLEESAAKNIYWSFFEGQKCILYWPE
ncbi:MAG: hypothetical protein PHF93_03860 [Acidobacteriota bacterium]|jgi:hypothetical protein|nr:hypothetical protein [Acidobacteriota bacterium]HOF82662.1 hypothetical protein [Candidatus Aminicenantes bacterium]MDD8029423.1 hypothetical protein [Acidobacteriota bacterium]MDD8032936.1 hypothetical protein [Acidobacteriota bacterium]MDD8037707.1 hypothetical protein [Acidobacteriota bacterium]